MDAKDQDQTRNVDLFQESFRNQKAEKVPGPRKKDQLRGLVSYSVGRECFWRHQRLEARGSRLEAK